MMALAWPLAHLIHFQGMAFSPMIFASLPRTDAWQNPILYWSNGASYRIISMGRDGEMDRDWSGAAEPAAQDLSSDIVFGDGHLLFFPWPQ